MNKRDFLRAALLLPALSAAAVLKAATVKEQAIDFFEPVVALPRHDPFEMVCQYVDGTGLAGAFPLELTRLVETPSGLEAVYCKVEWTLPPARVLLQKSPFLGGLTVGPSRQVEMCRGTTLNGLWNIGIEGFAFKDRVYEGDDLEIWRERLRNFDLGRKV